MIRFANSVEDPVTSNCGSIPTRCPAAVGDGQDETVDQGGLLTDRFGRAHTYLRISVTDRCNLRCLYCTPSRGITHAGPGEILRFEEILRLAELFASMGIRKIRLTGGEPLTRRGIVELVGELAGVAGVTALGMTTNGILLGGRAARLREAGLTHLNISLDTLRPERFAQIARRDGLPIVKAAIGGALQAGFVPLKLNMVVIGGINDDEVLDFVELTKSSPIHVRFIELMPFQAGESSAHRFVSMAAVKRAIEWRYRLIPIAAHPGIDPPVAQEFRMTGHVGRVGFIPSMSCCFCDRCCRLRLSANGSLKTCLFYPAEVSLRDAMRAGASDGILKNLIRQTLKGKKPAHPPMRELRDNLTQSMIEIGG